MNKVFYIFRHGQTDYNIEKRVQSFLDIPLNAQGIAQAKELAKNLADILIASFFLPKIRFDSDTDRTKISALKNLCVNYPFSNEILEKYMTSSDGNEIDYWRQ